MKDLTTGSIPTHVIQMAAPMAIGMLIQTLYFLVDLYFVARLGDAAVAGQGVVQETLALHSGNQSSAA